MSAENPLALDGAVDALAKKTTGQAFREMFTGGARKFGMVYALVILLVLFQIVTGGRVLTPTNAANIIAQNAHILIMAMGMVLVIIAGHIDLSVGSVMAVVGVIVAFVTRDGTVAVSGLGLPWWLGVIIGLGVGLAIGAWQGFWVAIVGIPGFITTLAGMMVFRGIHQWISAANGTNIAAPEELRFLTSSLPDLGRPLGLNGWTLIVGVVAILLVLLAEWRKRVTANRLDGVPTPMLVSAIRAGVMVAVIGYATFLFGQPGPLRPDGSRGATSFPVLGLVVIAFAAIYWFLSSKTITGRNVYAVGGNKHAASLSGVSLKKTNFLVMMNMSLLASVAAIIFITRNRFTGPADGTGLELDVIASVFIGGAAVSGGIGTVTGTVIGGLVMAVLNNGLQLMAVGAPQQQVIKGLVLLAAVAFDVFNKTQGKFSIIGKLIEPFRRGGDGDSVTDPDAADEALEADPSAKALFNGVDELTGKPITPDTAG